VGSLRFDGVRFLAYPRDHEPCHIHGFYGGTEAIVELQSGGRLNVCLMDRKDPIRPLNAKVADVRHILLVASAHVEELKVLWSEAHG
jgi:hypothetical protein